MGDFAKDFWLAYQLQPLCKINFLFESNNVCLVTTRSVRQRVDAVKRTAEGDPAKLMRQSPRAWVFLGNHRGFFKGQTVFNNIKNYWAPKLEVCIWSLFNYFGRTQSANIYIYYLYYSIFFYYPATREISTWLIWNPKFIPTTIPKSRECRLNHSHTCWAETYVFPCFLLAGKIATNGTWSSTGAETAVKGKSKRLGGLRGCCECGLLTKPASPCWIQTL